MDVGFAGTPAFAATALAAILEAGFEIPIVLTRPDRPQGRGLRVRPSPVKALAVERGVRLLQPAGLRNAGTRCGVLEIPIDVLVVAAYGLILPAEVLAWPRRGCLNIHASLLPRWRGAAPIERAILEGDTETGITIMYMDEGLDTGGIVDQWRVPISAAETTGTLTDRLAAVGADAIVAVLLRMRDGGMLAHRPQPPQGVTHAPKIAKSEGAIDWLEPAAAVARRVRAFDPAPGAAGFLGGKSVKVLAAEPVAATEAGAPPGRIISADASGIVVACGDGALRITALQPAGGRRMDAAAFVNGWRLEPGASFDPPPGASNRGASVSRAMTSG
jgi:methionyl-tRNA formyltransferase